MSDRLKRIEQLQQENQALREKLDKLWRQGPDEKHPYWKPDPSDEAYTAMRDGCFTGGWEAFARFLFASNKALRESLSILQEFHNKGQDELTRLREALRLLYDYQNGPPLPSYTEEWNRAMRLARAALAPQEGKQE